MPRLEWEAPPSNSGKDKGGQGTCQHESGIVPTKLARSGASMLTPPLSVFNLRFNRWRATRTSQFKKEIYRFRTPFPEAGESGERGVQAYELHGIDRSQQSGGKTLLIRLSGASLWKALDFRTEGLDLVLEAEGAREDWGKGGLDERVPQSLKKNHLHSSFFSLENNLKT